jgi:hypothetical protein
MREVEIADGNSELTVDQQKDLILSILFDFAEGDDLLAYMKHVGFDLGSILQVTELPRAWLGHYRTKKGVYDVDRACNDLSEFPPIASAIVRGLNQKRTLSK